ncbi:hypothetical protein GCM10027168_33200 [Streptomyces capparidis]
MHGLRRGVLRGVAEQLEPDAERDARLMRHPGELAAAHHADYGESHASQGIRPAAPRRRWEAARPVAITLRVGPRGRCERPGGAPGTRSHRCDLGFHPIAPLTGLTSLCPD